MTTPLPALGSAEAGASRIFEGPDLSPGNYYVSIKRGERLGLLTGPYATHAAALAMLPEARRLAEELDPWSAFDAFGTVRMADGYTKPGVLDDERVVVRCT